MSKVRVLYNNDGTVGVIHPVPKSRRFTESEEDWLDRVFAKATPPGTKYDDIDSSQLPDRKDRDSWRGEKGRGIRVDKP